MADGLTDEVGDVRAHDADEHGDQAAGRLTVTRKEFGDHARRPGR